jgi:hypothetical protein
MPLSEYMKSRREKNFATADKKEKSEPKAAAGTIASMQQARIPKPDSQYKGPKKRGEKLKELFKGYIKQVKIFLSKPEHLRCQIKSPVCLNLSTCVHHKAGRSGQKLKDEKDWLPSCEPCNTYVEKNDSWARERGFKTTRLGKVKK